MKRQLFAALAALLLLASCKDSVPTTGFKGRIIGYNGEYTEFFVENPAQPGEYIELPIEVAEDGTFDAVVQLPNTQYRTPLFVDHFMFNCFVEPGKNYTAEFNCTDPDDETNFRFIGEGEAENAFCNTYWNGLAGIYEGFEMVGDVAGFDDFMAALKPLCDDLKAQLAKIDNPGFVDYYTAEIDKLADDYALYYPFMAMQNGHPATDDAYEQWLAGSGIGEWSDQRAASTFNGLSTFFAYTCDSVSLKDAVEVAAHLAGANKTYADFAATAMLKNCMEAGRTDGLKEAYDAYCALVADENYRAQVTPLYETLSTMMPGTMAPDIEFADAEGNISHLSDLKGKALYVDFWATWCGPCCKEIPYMEKLAEQLAGDPDVECVSISLDEEIDNWKEKIATDKPAWKQFVLTEQGQKTLAETYGVNGIPRFMLFAADGSIASIDFARPSTTGILGIIREALVKE